MSTSSVSSASRAKVHVVATTHKIYLEIASGMTGEDSSTSWLLDFEAGFSKETLMTCMRTKGVRNSDCISKQKRNLCRSKSKLAWAEAEP
eukprot:1905783-Amphidinium_carterae.1